MPELLSLAATVARLGDAAKYFDLDVVEECASTNTELLARAERAAPSGTALAALRQTAGRGRRGREWISAPGDSLAFSLLWRFAPGTAPVGLSLAVGVAVVDALAKVSPGGHVGVPPGPEVSPGGTAPTQLKWPNDVLRGGRKLGGILVELLPGATHAAVIGIGINLRLPEAMPGELRAAAAALDDDTDPNALLAALLIELRTVLERFAASGFAALRDDWVRLHAYQDAPVVLLSDFGPRREGVCRGVDADGALLFESGGRIERILSGEISLRPLA